MNKIVMSLVLISCSSLFSMDSDITVKFLDDDGNVQAQRQVSAHVLKSKSNILKEMFNDIPVSEVCIPASEVPVKVWDEIESLWKLWDLKKKLPQYTAEAYRRLVIKKLDEMIEILNGLEYLQEPDEDSISSVLIPVLAHEIKERLNGWDFVSQQLKPRLTKLVINFMFPPKKLYKAWKYELKAIEASTFPISGDPFDFIKITYQPPENITISQATVLLKILKRRNTRIQYRTADGRTIDELKIYNTIDKNARSDIDYYFHPNGYRDCIIL